MLTKNFLAGIVGLAAVAEAGVIEGFPGSSRMISRRQNRNGNNDTDEVDDAVEADADLALDPDLVQEGSSLTGQEVDADPEQADSLTSTNNFINFCAGKTLTNGAQVETGSCNGIVMGDIPPVERMISTIFLNPQHNDNIEADTTFDIEVKVKDLQAGSFTEPGSTYYSAPQQLNDNDQVIGHMHIVCQDMGNSLNPADALDPQVFVFFKGINDNGDGNGLLTATVEDGLPAGSNIRCCSISGTANHQPPLMPVAQRGSQEDCVKFTVGGAADDAADEVVEDAEEEVVDEDAEEEVVDEEVVDDDADEEDNNGGNGNDDDDDAAADDDQETDVDVDEDEDVDEETNGGGNGGAFAADAIGGVAAPVIEDSGNDDRPFSVNGNTFVNKSAAVQRACDIQNNLCANAINSGQGPDGLTVTDCGAQIDVCKEELA